MENTVKTSVWGCYTFNFRNKGVINALLHLIEKHPSLCMLMVYIDKSRFDTSEELFDTQCVKLRFYYKYDVEELVNEIHSNPIIERNWIDSDSYDLTIERVNELKEQTVVTRWFLLKSLKASENFVNLVENIKDYD